MMPPLHDPEADTINLARIAYEADRYARYCRYYWHLIDADIPADKALAIVTAARADEAMNLEMAA